MASVIRLIRSSVLLCICLYGTLLPAAEVDQFTRPEGQPLVLADSAPVLTAEVNRRLALAVERANDRYMEFHGKKGTRWPQPRCDEERLYTMLTDQLAGAVIGELETFAEESPDIERRRVTLEQSIYRNFFWQASPTLMWSERVAAVIRLQGVEMGTDKLGHFFSEGYSYFLATEQLERDIESALLFGEWSESVYYGAQTTGVFSFADLVANTQGLRFWNRVLGRKPDPLTGQPVTPYVVCDGDRWQVAQAFAWDDYVDSGWSEAVNCPAFGSEELLERIRAHNVRCETALLPWSRYGAQASRLLNPQGHRVLPDHLQPEIILEERVANRDVDLSPDTVSYIAGLRLRLSEWRRASAAALRELKH